LTGQDAARRVGVGSPPAGRTWLGRWPDFAFLVAAAVVGTARFAILRRGGAPPTVDAGNWLAFGDSLLGHGVRSPTIVYPPLVPLLTKALAAALGITNGVSAMAALSSLAPAAGVYAALQLAGIGVSSLIPSALVLGASAVGEATAWGGFPQLIGLGITPVLLWQVWRLAVSWSRRSAVMSGVWLLLLATSHLVALAALLAAAMLVSARWIAGRPEVRGRVVVVRLATVVLPSLALIPTYVPLTRGLLGSVNPFHYLSQLQWSGLLGAVGFLFWDLAPVWWPLTVLALATPFLVRERRHPPWPTTTALLAAMIVLLAATREGRYLYLLTVIVGLAAGLWIDRVAGWWRASRVPDAGVAIGLVAAAAVVMAQVVVGLSFFQGQREYYGILSPGLVRAIDQAAVDAGPEGTIGVTSLRDAPLGWWVEALAHRPTIYAAPLRWLAFDDEIERASLADGLFEPPFPTAQAMDEAAAAGIAVIVLPTDWYFYDQGAEAELAAERPGSVNEFDADAALLYPGRS
jgi:hypothetical protein